MFHPVLFIGSVRFLKHLTAAGQDAWDGAAGPEGRTRAVFRLSAGG